MPAYYIVLQEKIPGIDAIGLEGHALSRYGDQLETLATQAGVLSLMSFFSANEDDMVGALGDDTAEKLGPIPDEQWFSAEEGVRTIEALRAELAARLFRIVQSCWMS